MIVFEIIEKLKEKTIYENNCWIYNGPDTGSGYTKIWFNFQQQYVHRVSAHIHHGLDLSDSTQQANHKPECKNRKCWNPDHIYVGNQADNIKDKIEAGTNQKGIFGKALQQKNQTHCKYGHEFTFENTRVSKENKRICKTCAKARDKSRLRSITTVNGVGISQG